MIENVLYARSYIVRVVFTLSPKCVENLISHILITMFFQIHYLYVSQGWLQNSQNIAISMACKRHSIHI